MPLTTFLNGNVPTQLRGLNWLALSDQGRVLTSGGTDDAGGGIRGSYTAGSYMPCRVDPLGTRGGITAEQVDERSTHIITTPPGTSVTTRDQFEVTNRGTFEITAVRTMSAEIVRELEAVAA